MQEGFEQATSSNLPTIDDEMIHYFYQKDVRYRLAGIANVKAARGSRETYGDDAVEFVQLKRVDNICTVKARITPEHKVREKGYAVSVTINEAEDIVEECECHGCVARAGGCKHGIALLFWLYRRTLQPSVTSVECYWRKSRLSKIGTAIKGSKIGEIYKRKICAVPKTGTAFLDRVVERGLTEGAQSLIVAYKTEKQKDCIDAVSLYSLSLRFQKYTCEVGGTLTATDFLEYCRNNITEEDCKEVQQETKLQSLNTNWSFVRFGRITASKVYEVAHCKTVDGVTKQAVLGASKFPQTAAMKRGLSLEEQVLQEMKKKLNISYSRVGIALRREYPLLGASADALTDDCCIEIKCPSKAETVKQYVEDGELKPKSYAQIQLQMFMYKKNRGLFCVASPDFENNRQVTVFEVRYDATFCLNLIEQATAFWQKAIFPTLIE